MKFNGEIIELFGEKLYLHERTIGVAFDHNEWAESQTKWDANSEIYLNVLILQKALQFNLDRLPIFTFNGKKYSIAFTRYKKLSRLLSTEYIFKNLGVGKLRELTDKVRFKLEKQSRNTQESEKVSRATMIQLVAKYSNMNWEEVELLSVNEFTIRLEQAVNMLNSERTGKFGIKSSSDEMKEWEKAYNHFYPENDTVN